MNQDDFSRGRKDGDGQGKEVGKDTKSICK